MFFPKRKDIKKDLPSESKSQNVHDKIQDEINKIDITKIDFTGSTFEPRIKIAEKQKVFIWVRLYLREESNDLLPEDEIIMKHINGEELVMKYICYAKTGYENSAFAHNNTINSYNSEDNPKVLCCMIDLSIINNDSDNIPFLRSLFRDGRYYDYQLLKLDELKFVNNRTSEQFNYFDVDF